MYIKTNAHYWLHNRQRMFVFKTIITSALAKALPKPKYKNGFRMFSLVGVLTSSPIGKLSKACFSALRPVFSFLKACFFFDCLTIIQVIQRNFKGTIIGIEFGIQFVIGTVQCFEDNKDHATWLLQQLRKEKETNYLE